MSEQVFLDFSLNFNLRQTKKNMPTIIYALFTFRGETIQGQYWRQGLSNAME